MTDDHSGDEDVHDEDEPRDQNQYGGSEQDIDAVEQTERATNEDIDGDGSVRDEDEDRGDEQ